MQQLFEGSTRLALQFAPQALDRFGLRPIKSQLTWTQFLIVL